MTNLNSEKVTMTTASKLESTWKREASCFQVTYSFVMRRHIYDMLAGFFSDLTSFKGRIIKHFQDLFFAEHYFVVERIQFNLGNCA